MADKKIIEMFERLYERSVAGLIEWAPCGENNSYQFSTGNYSLRMTREWNDEPEDWDFKIEIFDSQGRAVEEFWDISLLDSVGDGNRAKYYAMYKAVFEAARRKAMGADKAIDELMRFLG